MGTSSFSVLCLFGFTSVFESSSDMKFLVLALCLAVVYAQEAPEVNWGKCPQLEPTAEEQRSKGEVIQACLEKNPPPAEGESLTQEQIDAHRETITTCALKTEGWFGADNKYNYERAKKEIQNKNLTPGAEILKKHDECSKEAQENFPDSNIPQVQLYQACMDFHITKICEIKITPPPQAEGAAASASA
uniref:Odorant binding protein n=1 Tax=Pardosa pseudoannulata TaxID=330961 RepID=A0A3G1UTT8_9ARAC|nr:odorant binding protein [Pardosa pseudoannulata]